MTTENFWPENITQAHLRLPPLPAELQPREMLPDGTYPPQTMQELLAHATRTSLLHWRARLKAGLTPAEAAEIRALIKRAVERYSPRVHNFEASTRNAKTRRKAKGKKEAIKQADIAYWQSTAARIDKRATPMRSRKSLQQPHTLANDASQKTALTALEIAEASEHTAPASYLGQARKLALLSHQREERRGGITGRRDEVRKVWVNSADAHINGGLAPQFADTSPDNDPLAALIRAEDAPADSARKIAQLTAALDMPSAELRKYGKVSKKALRGYLAELLAGTA